MNKFSSKSFICFFSIAIVLVGLIHTYVLTHGDMNLFVNEKMGSYYTYSLDNIKKGRYDLDCSSMELEIYKRDGKCYMYFGVFPSMFRAFIELFLKRNSNTWSRISMLTAAIITVLSFTLTYYLVTFKMQISEFTRFFYTALYLLVISFGSPLLLLLSSGYIYHESIIWGLAWSSVFIFAFVYQICAGKIYPVLLLIMSFSCGFALNSRMTFGSIGLAQIFLILSLLVVIFLRNQRNVLLNRLLTEVGLINLDVSNRRLIIKLFLCMILPFLIFGLFAIKVNYERWGKPFIFKSDEHYEVYIHNPSRLIPMKEFGGFSFLRLPHSISYYFIPYDAHFTKDFPFTKLVLDNFFHDKFVALRPIIKQETFDYIEPSIPITLHSCSLVFLAIVGTFAFMKCFGLVGTLLFLPLFLQAVSMLGFYSMALRYTPEFLPILVVLSIPSFLVLTSFEKRSFLHKVLIRSFLIVLVLLNVYLCATTLLHLKLYLWTTSGEARSRITQFIDGVNNNIHKNFLKSEPLKAIYSDEAPKLPKDGQIWVKNNGEIYWFNGIEWIQLFSLNDKGNVVSTPIHLNMKITFNNPTVGVSDPLLSIGNDSCRDTVFVKYLPNYQAVLSFFHSVENKLIEGKPFNLNLQKPYNLEINLGNVNNPLIYMKVDGVTVFSEKLTRCTTNESGVVIGKGRIKNEPSETNFSGKILEVNTVVYPAAY